MYKRKFYSNNRMVDSFLIQIVANRYTPLMIYKIVVSTHGYAAALVVAVGEVLGSWATSAQPDECKRYFSPSPPYFQNH